MDYSLSKQQLCDKQKAALSHYFGVTPEEADYEQHYKALATVVRDMLRQGYKESVAAQNKAPGTKRIYYLCMEFLTGKSLRNNLFNLGLTDAAQAMLADFGVKIEKLYDCEPDAGLGNGGLGRLAACYLDALASSGSAATGYCILYEYGIFRQKLVDGWQTELPDFWLPGGEVWLVPRHEKEVEVRFEGTVSDIWYDNAHSVEHKGYKSVTAVPYDLYISGYGGKGVAALRLWSAQASEIDMERFNRGDYVGAMEQDAMAEVISKVLYPADNHPEGKSLRLRQQYFLVSASMQDIIHRHLRDNGSLDGLSGSIAIQLNDTHPAVAIPEFIRILLDECGYTWEDAERLARGIFSYTNHTVMSEALENWSEELVKRLLPRIHMIIRELDNRFRKSVWDATHDAEKVERTAIVSGGAVRMANLCVAVCGSVNGVSQLHTDILKNSVFADFYALTPDKFKNVTNGIAHRRWLCQANPGLAGMLTDLIGGGFARDAAELSKLAAYADDKAVLERLLEIKAANKRRLADEIERDYRIEVDPTSVFDVQAKRLHEYKRQHLNALNILARYLDIKDNPGKAVVPHTYLFAAKAAPGYFTAKKIISFICAVADLVNGDPDTKGKLRVVFLENYNVSMAERLMPAADISEQISLAGTEASGTGNMKLMLNGAVTLGTLDGANIEILEAVGQDNIFIFGLTAKEARALCSRGYEPMNYYKNNASLRRVIDFVNQGVAGKPFSEISGTIVHHDPYMVLADYEEYCRTNAEAAAAYADRMKFARMSLMNIAAAGRFSADRAVAEYARDIWHAGGARQ